MMRWGVAVAFVVVLMTGCGMQESRLDEFRSVAEAQMSRVEAVIPADRVVGDVSSSSGMSDGDLGNPKPSDPVYWTVRLRAQLVEEDGAAEVVALAMMAELESDGWVKREEPEFGDDAHGLVQGFDKRDSAGRWYANVSYSTRLEDTVEFVTFSLSTPYTARGDYNPYAQTATAPTGN